MKLHLGCGTVYLEGYVNIDYPKEDYNLKGTIKADKYADITKLRYKKNSIEEVRLHHVFEHFSRPIALALLASWFQWLEINGKINIEVPDFGQACKQYLNPLVPHKNKYQVLRHIFGSHEAHWAVHWEGWDKSRLHEIFTMIGFENIQIIQKKNGILRNIQILANKPSVKIGLPHNDQIKTYFRKYLISQTREVPLLDEWLKMYKNQLRISLK